MVQEELIEEWRPIRDFEHLYEVSNLGRVRSLPKKGCKRQDILNPWMSRNGYLRYTLRKDGKKCNKMAQQLVAIAFIPNPYNKKYVDHINTDKLNNTVTNLRWVTRQENSNNRITKSHMRDAQKPRKSLWADDIKIMHGF